MTPIEFFERLSGRLEEIRAGKNELTLSPGPMPLMIGEQDVYAARLILWLLDQMPDDVTFGEVEDIVIAALWWLHFWAAQPGGGLNEC